MSPDETAAEHAEADASPGPMQLPPAALASRAAATPRPLLVVCDLDGTLSPIALHAQLATLAHGAHDALEALIASGTPTAVVTGRGLADARERFGLSPQVHVIASHGLEQDGAAVFLSDAEEERRVGLVALAHEAALRAPGAWVEDKPAGVVLHVRGADPVLGASAIEWFERSLPYGTFALHAKKALEVAVRKASKAAAVARMRVDTGAASVLALGDDVTDEELFGSLGDGDVTVRVGGGDTVARYRLRGPSEAVEVLGHLAALLASAA
jgi:trehalose 6-phosphate phosphatase